MSAPAMDAKDGRSGKAALWGVKVGVVKKPRAGALLAVGSRCGVRRVQRRRDSSSVYLR